MGLLERLEARLRISLDRAISSSFLEPGSSITDLVAVVGVVAPKPYSNSVRSRMSEDRSPPPPSMLKAMMDAGRFVFIALPGEASSPVSRGGGK